MARQPNTVDFWRGFALVEILINHIPFNGLSRFTHSQFSWSDSAELFVFLAGWAFARRLHGRRESLSDMASFVGTRFAKIYVGQVMTAIVVIGLYLFAARALGDPGLLADNRASMAATEPLQFLAGILMLTEQFRYVDILPLYALLTLATPIFFLLNRRSTALLVALSGTLFAASFFARVNLPTWPEQGQWFFDPLSWQAMFVVGYALGRKRDVAERIVEKVPFIVPAACALIFISAISMVMGWAPDGEPAKDSIGYYFFGKSSLGLAPIPQFLALALIAARNTHLIARLCPPLWTLLSMLGRNSLSVFCAGTFLSAVGQILHRAGLHGALFDIGFTLGATAILCLVAILRERSRQRRGAPATYSAPVNAASLEQLA